MKKHNCLNSTCKHKKAYNFFTSFLIKTGLILFFHILFILPCSAEKWLSYNTGSSQGDLHITDLAADQSQKVYCSAKSGIHFYNGTDLTKINLNNRKNNSPASDNAANSPATSPDNDFYDQDFDSQNNLIPKDTEFLSVCPIETGDTLNIDRFPNFWAGTNTGLYKFKNNTLQRFTPDTCGLPDSTVICLENMGRSVWAGTQKGLGQSFGDFLFKSLTTSEGLPGNQINDLKYHDDQIWAALTGGVASISENNSITSWPLDFSNGSNVWASAVCPVTDDMKTFYAIGFAGSGVSFLDQGTYTNIQFPHPGLPSKWVTDIEYMAEKKELWIGTKKGLVRYNLDTETMNIYNSSSLEILKSDEITCLLAQKNVITGYESAGEQYSLWIGTASGGLYRWLDVRDKKQKAQTSAWRTFLVDEDHDEYHNVAALNVLGKNITALMYCMPAKGVPPKKVSSNYYKTLEGNDRFKKCSFRGAKYTPPQLPALFPAMASSSNHTAWLGGKWSIIQEMLINVDENMMINQYFTQENTDFTLYDLDISVLHDDSGTLHILTSASNDPCTYFTYTPEQGFKTITRTGYSKKRGSKRFFSDYRPTDILISDSQTWITTLGGGIIHFDGENWHEYTSMSTSGGLLNDKVFCCSAGPDNQIWFGTPDGAVTYHKGQWSSFTTKEGLPGSSVKDILFDAQDPSSPPCMWFATNAGVCQWVIKNNTAVKHIKKENKSRKNGEDISLCADGANCITITGDYIWFGTTNGVSRFDRHFVLPAAPEQ